MTDLQNAREQGQLQFDRIREMVDALNAASEDRYYETARHDAAERAIYDSPLSVQVRSGWYAPGSNAGKPEEYEILLCTGGPAVRVVGDLDEYGEPTSAWLEVQDWGTMWAEFLPDGVEPSEADEILLDYARCFYFGD